MALARKCESAFQGKGEEKLPADAGGFLYPNVYLVFFICSAKSLKCSISATGLESCTLVRLTEHDLRQAKEMRQLVNRTPVIELLELGATVALTMDGSMLTSSFDMFDAMKRTKYLHPFAWPQKPQWGQTKIYFDEERFNLEKNRRDGGHY